MRKTHAGARRRSRSSPWNALEKELRQGRAATFFSISFQHTNGHFLGGNGVLIIVIFLRVFHTNVWKLDIPIPKAFPGDQYGALNALWPRLTNSVKDDLSNRWIYRVAHVTLAKL